jgi:lysozyme family protein
VDVVQRRTSLAVQAFARGLMPVATIIAAAAVVWGIRKRDRILADVQDRPAWEAALGGGVAAGVIGSLANDSGPVLLVLGTVVLAAAALYLRSRPSP